MKSKRDLVEYALKRAPQSPDHAEDVLKFFCDAVDRNDGWPDRVILTYLAQCFRHILDGRPPNEALNLGSRPRGQRRRRTLETKDETDIKLARAVVRRMNHGDEREAAIGAVADDANASSSRTRKAYETYAGLVRRSRLE